MPPPVTRAAAFTIFEESRDTEQDKKFGQEIAMESDKENLWVWSVNIHFY